MANNWTGALDRLRNARSGDDSELDTVHKELRGSLPELARDMTVATDSVEMDLQIRVLGNLVADDDEARHIVIEHHQDALQAAQRWALKSDTTDAQNLVLSLVFNLTNDYDKGIQWASADETFRQFVFTVLEKCSRHSELQSGLLAFFIEQMDPESLPDEVIENLLSLDDEELGTATLRVLEASQRFEKKIAASSDLFRRLYNLCMRTVEEETQRALAAIGNVTSHVEFSDMVRLEDDVSRADRIVAALDAGHTGQAAVGCIVLGNLATSADVVARLVGARPDIIDKVLDVCTRMTNPFELQSVHLLKNISIDPKYRKQLVLGGAAILVDRLMAFQAFPTLRFLGAQLTRNLVSGVDRVDRSLVQIIAGAVIQEPDGTVRTECELAIAAAIETLVSLEHAGPYLDVCVRTLVRVLKVSDDPRLLLKTTKALGVAVVFKPELFATPEVRPYLTIHFDSADKIDASTPEGRGASQNLGFLAAQLQKAFPEMAPVSQRAISHASSVAAEPDAGPRLVDSDGDAEMTPQDSAHSSQ